MRLEAKTTDRAVGALLGAAAGDDSRHPRRAPPRRPDADGTGLLPTKRAEGKSPLEAIRALKRRLSDVLFRALVEDHRRREAAGPEGHVGATLDSSAADLTPMISISEKPQSGPARSHATPRRARAKASA